MRIRLREFFLIVVFIFICSLSLRLYRLDLNVPNLYVDETGHYEFYNLINYLFPISPAGLIDYLYRTFYTLTWLLGLNPLGVRLPAAIFSALTVFSYGLFSSSLARNYISSKRKAIVLISILLISVLPWSYLIGRIGYTHIPILINLVLLHLFFYLNSKRTREYLVSLIFLFIGLMIYPSMVIVAPLVSIPVFFAIYNSLKKFQKKIFIFLAFILAAISLLTVNYRFKLFSLSGRGLDLAIWRDMNTTYDSDWYRELSRYSRHSLFSFNLPTEKLANSFAYNRVTANISVFIRNYLSFFSPDWLFIRGDAILRHSTGQFGVFYPYLLPFMLYGAFRFFKGADKRMRSTFLVWILVSPIPAAITKDGAGYLLRTVTMLPFLTYFCALGLVESFRLIGNRWRLLYGVMVALVGLYTTWSFFYGYFHIYPSLSARSYEYGFKELSEFQVNRGNASMLIIWDGYYHNDEFRFWQRTPFDQHKAFALNRIDINASVFWQTFPNLYFSAPNSVQDLKSFIKQFRPGYVVLPDTFFASYPKEIIGVLKHVEEIRYPDGTVAFTIYSTTDL